MKEIVTKVEKVTINEELQYVFIVLLGNFKRGRREKPREFFTLNYCNAEELEDIIRIIQPDKTLELSVFEMADGYWIPVHLQDTESGDYLLLDRIYRAVYMSKDTNEELKRQILESV